VPLAVWMLENGADDSTFTEGLLTNVAKHCILAGRVDQAVSMFSGQRLHLLDQQALRAFLIREPSLPAPLFQRLFAYFFTAAHSIEPFKRGQDWYCPDGSFFQPEDFKACLQTVARLCDKGGFKLEKIDRLLAKALEGEGVGRAIVLQELGERLLSWKGLTQKRVLSPTLPPHINSVVKQSIKKWDFKNVKLLKFIGQTFTA
jgi:hypothetical protein